MFKLDIRISHLLACSAMVGCLVIAACGESTDTSTTVRIAPIDKADAVAAAGGMFTDEFSCDQVTDRFLLETYGAEDAFEECEADVSRNRTSDKMASAKVLVADSARATVKVRSTSGVVAKVELVRDGDRLKIDAVVPVD